ncbi:MAG: CRISPR system precrRNA processing endoribonuclease RAMP protein Cas6 [Vulcanimicrobiota bacterium]
MCLELTLLGRATDHAGEFLEALRLAGKHGLGSTQARFETAKVQVQEGETNWVCYDRNSPGSTYLPTGSALGSFVEGSPQPATAIRVQFVTPTLLVHLNEPSRQPEFHVLLRAIARRLDSLLGHHAGQKLDFDFRGEIQAAHSIQLVESALEWADWERTSSRQKTRHRMGGIVGHAVYAGNFRPQWIQMLQCATLVHVGKATTFGMGSIFCEIGANA